MRSMTAKEEVLERLPGWSDAQAIAALASRAEVQEPAIIEAAIEPLTSSASSTGLLHGSTFWNVA